VLQNASTSECMVRFERYHDGVREVSQ
jgi:hypothetical protein